MPVDWSTLSESANPSVDPNSAYNQIDSQSLDEPNGRASYHSGYEVAPKSGPTSRVATLKSNCSGSFLLACKRRSHTIYKLQCLVKQKLTGVVLRKVPNDLEVSQESSGDHGGGNG